MNKGEEIGIIGIVFLLIIVMNNAEAVYTDCDREVDEDKLLTFAEKQIQKQNCKTYGDRYGEISCETFNISIRASEGHGKFVDNIIDLGTIMNIDGVGACNTDVILILEKEGTQLPDIALQHGSSAGVFGTQFFFNQFIDEGEYTLTAVNERTGEESVVEFSVRQLDNPEHKSIPSIQEQNKQEIEELENRIVELEVKLEKKDAILMEQLRVISDLAHMIKNAVYNQIISFLNNSF